jgi:DNA (cytosine-5)-methyltransferase 1
LFTYSFPCTNISFAGKQAGMEKDSGTASSLLWNCQKTIESKKPKFLLLENVAALVSAKYKPYFDEWCKILEENGYSNYWKIMNAKDYGVPQNRKRVFMVSIRSDIDKGYEFPKPIELQTRLKDLLDENVASNYYLPQERVELIKKNIL